MPTEDKAYEHDYGVISAIPGAPLASINEALNEGSEVDSQVMFNALGECIIVCHIKKERLKANLPLPKAVEVEWSDT